MNSEWVMKPIGELITLQRGHDLPSQDRKEGIVPIMGSSGITGYHNEAKTKGPGVVVGRSGNSMGEVSFSLIDYWPLNTCLYVTDFKENDALYIYYLLQTVDFDQFNSGSAQKSLNRNAVYPYEVKITECKNNQIKIGRILSEIENKIELNRQINQTLESMAQAIFQSWFVDFDPVKAKIAAREQWQTLTDGERSEWLNDIVSKQAYLKTCLSELTANGEQNASETLYLNIAAMTAISSRDETSLADMPADEFAQLYKTASLFPKRLVESELGEIPEGWHVGNLNNYCEFQNGYAFKGKDWTDNGCAVVKIGSVKPGIVDIKNVSYVGLNTTIGLDKFKLETGDILVGMTGYVGETGLVPYSEIDIFLNQRVGKFVFSKTSKIFYAFVYCAVRREEYKSYAESKSSGSAQANVSGSALISYPIILADKGIIFEFSSMTEKLIEKILRNYLEIQYLINARDSLLPKLLSGELDVTSLTELADIEPAAMDV